MSHDGSSQFLGHRPHVLNPHYFSPPVVAATSPSFLEERTQYLYQSPAPVEPLRSKALQHLERPDSKSSSARSTMKPLTESAGTPQPIKLPNALRNLRILKPQSTTDLGTAAHSQQDFTARNAREHPSTYTPPLHQAASSPLLSPPFSIPSMVSSHVTVAAAIHGKDSPAANQITEATMSETGLAIHNVTAEPQRQDHKQFGTLAIKEGKMKKESKEEKEKRRAARKEKKEKKEAKKETRAEKVAKSQIEEDGSITSSSSVAAHFNEGLTHPQCAFQSEKKGLSPDTPSTTIVPPNQQATPPTFINPAQISPIAHLLTTTPFAPISESPSYGLLKDKSHKHGKSTQLEQVGSSTEQKKKVPKPKTSFPRLEQSKDQKTKEHKEDKSKSFSTASAPPTNFSALTHTAESHPRVNSPHVRYQPDQTCSTTTQPQIVIIQPPSHLSQHPPYVSSPPQHPPYASPPSYHRPYLLNDYSYPRVSMSYEPQHRPSLELRFDSNPPAIPTAKKGPYTYSPLAQNDVIDTAYSHDYGQPSARPAEMAEHIEAEDESKGCCGWFCGGNDNGYEKQQSKAKQGRKPKKHRDEDEDDDGCVVM